MSKRIANIDDYITAHEAAAILSRTTGKPISAGYVSTFLKRKHAGIRTVRKHAKLLLYHRGDIEQCRIGTKG